MLLFKAGEKHGGWVAVLKGCQVISGVGKVYFNANSGSEFKKIEKCFFLVADFII